MRPHAPVPVAHPIALLAVSTLLVNDQWLKYAYPSWFTGKLSDFAGLVFFPLLLVSLVPRSIPLGTRIPLFVACAATATAFALVKVWSPANELYRVGLGLVQWPFRSAAALLSGHPLPRLAKVSLVRDASDLLALPMVIVAYALGGHARSPSAPPSLRERSLRQRVRRGVPLFHGDRRGRNGRGHGLIARSECNATCASDARCLRGFYEPETLRAPTNLRAVGPARAR